MANCHDVTNIKRHYQSINRKNIGISLPFVLPLYQQQQRLFYDWQVLNSDGPVFKTII
jgi:hypothetical protein